MLTQDEIDRLVASRDELAEHLRREIEANNKYAEKVTPRYPELVAYFKATATQHKLALLRAGISEES